jgi:thymidylate synthase
MQQYHDALKQILKQGIPHKDRTGVGTLSLFGEVQMIFQFINGFPILTTKKIPLRWIFEELMWFLRGDTNNQNLTNKGIDIWNEWATTEKTARFNREEDDLGPIYGYLWRSFGGDYPVKNGVDQIANLMKDLDLNPNSRRLIISGWDPKVANNVDLPPCHTLFQLKVDTINDKPHLSCKLYQRSADFFLGVPFNISSYALLTCMIAYVMGMIPHKFIHTFGDAHIYNNHTDQVNELLSRTPKPLPTLQFVNAEHLVGKGLDGLLGFTWENIQLTGYDPYEKISAPVAI